MSTDEEKGRKRRAARVKSEGAILTAQISGSAAGLIAAKNTNLTPKENNKIAQQQQIRIGSKAKR